ncbi:MAG: GntR family transcriptional regulator [Candidatus Latescibacterota bacterium]|jgi:GntR family transcriptional regulator|nr:MAG: GntR family transcriptional regulator [Candidatus Latescibacterota bacterium]
MYKQVTDQIKDAIATGALAPETKLPSIREMAAELGISPITIKRAYSDLESEGFVVTRAGLGSFVAGMNRERLREEKAGEIREELRRIVRTAAAFGVPIAEIETMVSEMKEERHE